MFRTIIDAFKVKEIRKKIEEKTGKKCIPVWHKSRGIEEFKNLLNSLIGGKLNGCRRKRRIRNGHT